MKAEMVTARRNAKSPDEQIFKVQLDNHPSA